MKEENEENGVNGVGVKKGSGWRRSRRIGMKEEEHRSLAWSARIPRLYIIYN